MYKSKLISLFKTLENKQLREFDAYITAKSSNLPAQVLQLYSIVKATHPNYTSSSLDRKAVIQKLYPQIFTSKRSVNEEAFKKAEADWRRLMTHLTKLLEDFLVFQELITDELIYKTMLLRIYNKRNLRNIFDEEFNKFTKPETPQTVYGVQFYLARYLAQEEAYNAQAFGSAAGFKRNIPDVLYSLEHHFLIDELRYTCDLYNMKNVWNVAIEPPMFLDSILQVIEQNTSLQQHPVIGTYYALLLMQRNIDKEEYYNQFITLLEQYSPNLERGHVMDLYIYAVNFCATKINNGQTEYYQKSFNLYTQIYDENNTFKHKYITKDEFSRVAIFAIRVHKLSYAEKFIEVYTPLLPAENRKTTAASLKSELTFAQKNYETSLDLAREVNTRDPYMNMNTKVLMLKCYYELNESRQLEAGINAASAFLTVNDHIPDNNKEAYRLFLYYLRKITGIREGTYKREKKQMLQEIKQEMEQKNLTTWWLYEKVIQLL